MDEHTNLIYLFVLQLKACSSHHPTEQVSSAPAHSLDGTETLSSPAPASLECTERPGCSARVLALLQRHACSYGTLEHAATRTCEESAAVRGVEVASGAKAMLLKCSKPLPHGSPYLLAVLSAARKADLKALRAALGQKSVSLASVEDVDRLTGCIPGAVPPFGSLFGAASEVQTYADPSILTRHSINFNCGLQTLSVLGLPVADYVRVERPIELCFAAPENA